MSARINYNRITGSNIQGDATTVTEPLGTLVVTNNGDLRLHDGTTQGGVAVSGSGGGFATTSTLVNGTYTVALSTTGQLNLPSAANTESDNARIQSANSIDILANLAKWTFSTNSNLTVPGTIVGNSGALDLNYDGSVVLSGIPSVDAVIQTTNNGSSNTSTWTFGTDGGLTLPLGGYITAPSAMGSNTVIQAPVSNRALLQNSDGTNLVAADDQGVAMTTVRGTVQFGYNLEAPGVPTHFHINKLNQSFDLFFGDDSNYFHLPAGGGSPVIGANDGSSGQKLWTFGQDGTLNLPDSASAGTAIIQTTSAINIQVNSNAHVWTFGTDGSLTVPGDIKSVADTGDVVIHANNGTQRTWTFGGDGTTIFPNSRIDAKDDLTLRVSGVPNAVTGLTGSSTGGWSGSYTNLSTSGGSGTGLTVNASESGSGYIDTVTINTPGHGYTNGDTITITSGGATAYFTISILPAQSWQFSGDGSLTFPDSTRQTTAYAGPQIRQTTVTLTPADLAGLNSYPGKTLVSAAGLTSNQVIVVTALEFSLTYNTTPYTTTANLYLNYSGNYLTVAQAIPAGNTTENNTVGMLTSSRNTYRYVQNGMVDGDFPPQQDVILMSDGAISNGDSDLRVRVTYIITGLF